jgi:FMN reductase
MSKLAVVTAGLGQPSSSRLLADRLSAATLSALRTEGADADVAIIELRDHAQELTNNLLTGFPAPSLQATIDEVVNADGLIAVTPIFTASYSGLFNMFFDVLEVDSLSGKPVLIGATGGTERHSLALDHALRPLFAYLRALVAPTAVYAASSDWGSRTSPGGPLTERIERAGAELAGLVQAHGATIRVDPFDVPTPFEQLLAGS